MTSATTTVTGLQLGLFAPSAFAQRSVSTLLCSPYCFAGVLGLETYESSLDLPDLDGQQLAFRQQMSLRVQSTPQGFQYSSC